MTVIGTYDQYLVTPSVAVACLASCTALDLAGRIRGSRRRTRPALLATGATAMGGGIWSIHVIGMLAFFLPVPVSHVVAAPGAGMARGVPVLAQTDLALAIATVAFVILLLALAASAFGRKLRLAEREGARLRENEEWPWKLYRGTPLPLHAVGLDGRIKGVSDAWLKLLGYPRNDIIGRELTDFMTEDSRRRYDETMWPRVQLGDDVEEVEFQFVRKSGEVLDVLLSACQERPDDKPARILGGIVDITARKRAETRLAEREARLALFIEHAPAAIAMFDDKMRFLAVSSRFLSDYRLPAAAEIIGRSHDEILPDTPR